MSWILFICFLLSLGAVPGWPSGLLFVLWLVSL